MHVYNPCAEGINLGSLGASHCSHTASPEFSKIPCLKYSMKNDWGRHLPISHFHMYDHMCICTLIYMGTHINTPHTRAHRGTHLPLFLMWIALRKPFKQQEVINWIRNLLGVIVRQIRTTILDFWVVANRTVNLQSICWILAQNLMIQSLYPLKVQGLWGNEYSGFSSIPKEPGVSIRMAAITITANCH